MAEHEIFPTCEGYWDSAVADQLLLLGVDDLAILAEDFCFECDCPLFVQAAKRRGIQISFIASAGHDHGEVENKRIAALGPPENKIDRRIKEFNRDFFLISSLGSSW